MDQPKYQVGDMIYVFNVNTTRSNGPRLAEVLGYSMAGNVTYLTYVEVDKDQFENIPVIFEDSLTRYAGPNARMIYGKT